MRAQQAHVYAKDLSEVWAPVLGMRRAGSQQADVFLDDTSEAEEVRCLRRARTQCADMQSEVPTVRRPDSSVILLRRFHGGEGGDDDEGARVC